MLLTEAVTQRKANRKQKLCSKEKKANRLAEKAKQKKEHFKQVGQCSMAAAANRGGALQDNDDGYLANGSEQAKESCGRPRLWLYGGKGVGSSKMIACH